MAKGLVTLTAEQRETLEAVLRRTRVTAGLAKRVRVILLLADKDSVSAVGQLVQMHRRHVYKWAERYSRDGLAGLNDQKRSGRPPVFSPRGRDSARQNRLRTAG